MDEGRGGVRIPARLIVAGLIALAGIVTYFMQSSTNPTTGEVQHVAMTEDQEIALGLQAAPRMAAEMGGAIDPASSDEARAVGQIGRQLVAESDARGSPYEGHFDFHLLDDERTINAFALPGGQIFITKALYDRLENTAQLAGVLGHEMGHVINRHAAEQMSKQQLGQSLAGAFAVGASDPDDPGRSRMAAAAAMMANKMLQLRYSRGDESEADAYGLRYMAQAGYDPEAMLGVMKVLESAGGPDGPAFLLTHPPTRDREQQIQKILDEDYAEGGKLTMGRPLPRDGGY
jgi:predicted Zn-dependent protease